MNVTEADIEGAILTILRDLRYAVPGTMTIVRDSSKPERAVAEAAA